MNQFDPTKHLTMEREDRDSVSIFTLRGECDMHTAPYARLEITPMLQAGRGVVINLAETSFMDSAGYGMLVGLARAAQDRGAGFAVSAPPSGIVRTGLKVLQVDNVLTVTTSLDEAVDKARG